MIINKQCFQGTKKMLKKLVSSPTTLTYSSFPLGVECCGVGGCLMRALAVSHFIYAITCKALQDIGGVSLKTFIAQFVEIIFFESPD